MKHKATLWIFICLLIPTPDIAAVEEVGMEILNTCLSERRALSGDPVSSVRYGLCLGYLKGIADTLNGKSLCLPETGETAIITQRLKQVYIKYAMKQPNALNLAATKTVIPAFQQAFPCN